MSFIWPGFLLTLLLIPLLVLWYRRLLRRRRAAEIDLGPLGLLTQAPDPRLAKRRHLPPLRFLIGLSLLLFSLARPQMVVQLPRAEGTVILAFDISGSMLADDLEPTRIEAAKAAARSFVENQPPTILVGVVAFSNGGLVVQLPTDDQTAVLETIDRLTPQGGTSLGEGIFSSLNAIAGRAITADDQAGDTDLVGLNIGSYPSAVIVMLTDGENTEQLDPLEIAQIAATADVRIYPIGIGSPEGTVLEVDGFSILTQLNEEPLQTIASLTNGEYYRAEDAEALQNIYETIDLQLTVRGEEMEITALLALAAVSMLLVGAGLSFVWFDRLP